MKWFIIIIILFLQNKTKKVTIYNFFLNFDFFFLNKTLFIHLGNSIMFYIIIRTRSR